MTAELTILSIFPDQFNVNGDAENALVLAARSRWGGHTAEIIRLGVDDETPAAVPGIVVVGSTTDVALPGLLVALARHRSALVDWVAAGVPVLAIGTGWELLSDGLELAVPGAAPSHAASFTAGLGIFPGRAVEASGRVSDDLVVSSRFGRLVGYENHARDYLLPESAEPLGEIVYGRGNGAGVAFEGQIAGHLLGTHLHGPVLAKNPAIADHLLRLSLGDSYDSRTVPAGRVDDMARAARNAIATRLEIGAE